MVMRRACSLDVCYCWAPGLDLSQHGEQGYVARAPPTLVMPLLAPLVTSPFSPQSLVQPEAEPPHRKQSHARMRAKMDISRRKFLKMSAALGGTASLATLGFAIHEPHQLSVEEVEVYLPRLAPRLDGFRLALLSDIHFDEFTHEAHLNSAVQQANALAPDVVILAGDFVTEPTRVRNRVRAAEKAWPCAEIVRLLRARHGVFATLGNHDYRTNSNVVIEALNQSGIEVLRNGAVAIEREGARLWLVGLDDALQRRADPERALRKVPANEGVIVAVHEPDFADNLQKYDVDFQISGHSHGGQVRLPLVGPLYLPAMGVKYPMGLRRVGRMQLYTTRGLGVVGLPFRLMCPPEVTLFTVRASRGWSR